jgi:endo-1,4-beta-xylanase
MKKINVFKTELILCLAMVFLVLDIQNINSQTYCTTAGTSRYAGVIDGFRYELWNQNGQGTACMTIDSGAQFSGEWSGLLNYLARRGLGYNQTQEHQQIGRFSTTYNCTYNPSSASGNSYLAIYGWTVDPLVEYYIIEDWRNWIPSMDGGALPKGSITVNGSVYDIWENTRTDQPSIFGTATFQQYFSIRRDERNSGTINISDHFEKWGSLGMDMGKMYEVSFVVEGYESSGTFDFTALDFTVDLISAIDNGQAKSPTSFSVFPNPAKDYIKLNITEPVKVNIYTTLGQLIKTAQVSPDNDLIQLGNLPSGNYVINIQTRDEVISETLSID